MSRPGPPLPRIPLIQLVNKANLVLQTDMVEMANKGPGPRMTYAHNAVFSTLQTKGSRASDMAAAAGITRQSMGEIIRGMVELGVVEMKPDPDDKRAKIVVYTPMGHELTARGFQHILDLEQRFSDEFGEDYETTRRVLARVAEIVAEEGDES